MKKCKKKTWYFFDECEWWGFDVSAKVCGERAIIIDSMG